MGRINTFKQEIDKNDFDLDDHDVGELSGQLYHSLTLALKDTAFTIACNVENGCGLGSWRRLCQEFDPVNTPPVYANTCNDHHQARQSQEL